MSGQAGLEFVKWESMQCPDGQRDFVFQACEHGEINYKLPINKNARVLKDRVDPFDNTVNLVSLITSVFARAADEQKITVSYEAFDNWRQEEQCPCVVVRL